MNEKLEVFIKSLITALGWVLGTISYILLLKIGGNSITVGIFIICILLGSIALISLEADSLKGRVLLALTPTLGAVAAGCIISLAVGDIFSKVLF